MGDAGQNSSVVRWGARIRAAPERLRPKRFRAPSLDALNFLVADVRGALGPYVTVFLADDQHWDLTSVGLVMTLGGWLGLSAQTPLGWLLDATGRRRGLIAAALVLLGGGALAIALFPSFWPVLAANGIMQVVGGIFQPAVAALTVGLFARRDLTRRMGRNAGFARAGNLTIAAVAGVVAWRFSARDVFFLVPLMALGGVVAALSIPDTAIDPRRARGLRSGEHETEGPRAWQCLLHSRPFLIFAAFSLILEFADAPLLTLAAQLLGAQYPGLGTVITSYCIGAQQAGMLVAAFVVGHRADAWGHRRLLFGSGGIIVAQGVLTAISGGFYPLIAVQVLGGVGIGLFAALTPLLLSDVTAGTGRYNLAQGMTATVRALGVTSSGLAAELAVKHFGYDAAFLGDAALAGVAVALLWLAMPETRPELG